MSGKLESFLHRLEARPHSFSALLIVTGFVGVGRAMQEYLFFGEKLTAAIGISMAIAYFHLAVALTVLLSFTTGHDWKRLQNAVYLGIFLGLFPPFIDLAISGFNGAVFYRFYLSEDFRQIPWHFYAPAIGAPAGETAVVWLSIFLTSSYAFWKTQSWWRMLATLVLAYGYFMLHFALVPITTIYWLRLGAAAFGKSSIVHAAEIAPAFFPFWYLALSVILYIAL
ncbi:MAG: hypothetical protein N2Z22_11350, partial [Turneriella sp.]|nr:hypothetical protein [Turneriella sp.]